MSVIVPIPYSNSLFGKIKKEWKSYANLAPSLYQNDLLVRKFTLISFSNYMLLIISLKLTIWLNRNFLYKISKRVKLVHAHFIFPDGYIAYQLYKKYGIPYVITYRDQSKIINNSWRRKIFNEIVNDASALTSISAHAKKILEQETNKKVNIIPHGIEKEILMNNDKRFQKETIDIIIVAEMIELKHIDWVVHAFNSLTKKNHCKLFIVGDGPLYSIISSLTKNSSNIQLLGHLSRKKTLTLLEKTDIFVLPSFPESFGVVYLEAMAKKNATIGIRNSGVCGLFKEGKEIIISERNKESLTSVLNKIVDDDELRKNIAINGFNAVRNSFCLENIVEKYYSMYDEVLKE